MSRLGTAPQLCPLAPEQTRLRLYEAVSGFLATLAAGGTLLLVLDDLQWVNGATCDLLIHGEPAIVASGWSGQVALPYE